MSKPTSSSELAFGQEQRPAAEGLVQMAEGGALSLCLPVFAVGEALSTASRRAIDRDGLLNRIRQVRQLLRRHIGRKPLTDSLNETAAQLASLNNDERTGVENVLSRLRAVSSVLPLDVDVDARARDYRERLGLATADAFVFASVTADLSRLPPGNTARHLFLSRDQEAFAKRRVKGELAQFGCDYVNGFPGGLARARAVVVVGLPPGPSLLTSP